MPERGGAKLNNAVLQEGRGKREEARLMSRASFFYNGIIRIQNCMNRIIGEGWPSLPELARPRIHNIAEPAYVIDPTIYVDSKITVISSANPLFSTIFTAKDRYNGSLFRYIQDCNGIRDNKGIQFL
jgi:hypothetical protein